MAPDRHRHRHRWCWLAGSQSTFTAPAAPALTDYLGGLQNPLEASYHVRRSLEAIINGGLFGVGIGHSSTKFTGLPVAHTDSIFAIVAEEVGLLGTGALILAYLTILWRGLVIAKNAPDLLGRLLACRINHLDHHRSADQHGRDGQPAAPRRQRASFHQLRRFEPGHHLDQHRDFIEHWPVRPKRANMKEGNNFAAVVDLRWRDRRGRVSRTVRSAGSRE